VRNRPDIAESISRILAARAAELAGRQAAAPAPHGPPHRDILERIRHYFGIAEKSSVD
jgi:hypothetical protein